MKWLRSSKLNQNSFSRTAHVLVVNNTKYLFFARICIESFMHFHPKSTVVLHCDLNTYNPAKKYFSITKRFRKILIVCDQDINTDWKLSKLRLLLSMNGTTDIFMDADLRWNGSLNLDRNIYFLVREFPFWKFPEYFNYFSSIKIKLNHNKYMWNTSFFTFNSNQIDKEIIDSMYDFYEELLSSFQSRDKTFNSNSIKERLIEQLTMSFFADEFGFEVKALKENDSRLDGSLVESAYFGSTGLGF